MSPRQERAAHTAWNQGGGARNFNPAWSRRGTWGLRGRLVQKKGSAPASTSVNMILLSVLVCAHPTASCLAGEGVKRPVLQPSDRHRRDGRA